MGLAMAGTPSASLPPRRPPGTGTIASIPVGSHYSYPLPPVFASSNADVFVANFECGACQGYVYAIDGETNEVTTTIAVGLAPGPPTYDTDNALLYVPNSDSSNVSVINPTSDRVIASIGVGAGPSAPLYDPDNGYLYVPNAASDNVTVLSGSSNTVVANISLGGSNDSPQYAGAYPCGAYDPGNQELYVPTFSTAGTPQLNNVTVISTKNDTVVARVPVGLEACGIVVDPANGDVYVENSASDTISVIDGNTSGVIATLTVGSGPLGVPAFDPTNDRLFVANWFSQSVSVVNTSSNTVIRSVSVGPGPAEAVYDPSTGELYVPDTASGHDAVTVINGTTDANLGEIAVGIQPSQPLVDPANGDLYVTNMESYNVTVIETGVCSTQCPVTFQETGLPAGTNWSVVIDNDTNVTRAPGTNNLILPGGTFAFTIPPLAGYIPSPSSGSLTVDGHPRAVNITWTIPSSIVSPLSMPTSIDLGQTVTFTEDATLARAPQNWTWAGLPPGVRPRTPPSCPAPPTRRERGTSR